MPLRQKATPDLGVSAIRGWCLKYVDDGVKAPARQPSATAAYNVENRSGNIRTSELPIGIWVPLFYALTKGPYVGLGHVQWGFNHGNGWIEIHDSETRTGARAVYRNINEVLAWFANHGPKYLGWSLWVDGVQVVEEYTVPAPQASTGRTDKSGRATVTVNLLNVRNEPNDNGAVVAQYTRGQVFNYDSYIISDGFVWLSYVSYSGVRRYVAEGPADGNASNVYVSGGVSR
jgi:hypothetical protein